MMKNSITNKIKLAWMHLGCSNFRFLKLDQESCIHANGLKISMFPLLLAVFVLCFSTVSRADTYYAFASDVPLAVRADIGCAYLNDTIIADLVADIQNGVYPTGTYPYHEHGFDDINLILFREYNSNENKIQVYAFCDGFISDYTFPSDYNSTSTLCNFRSLNNHLLRIEYDLDDNSITYVSSSSGNTYLVFYALGNNYCWIENLSVGMIPIYAIKQQFNIVSYPIYLRDGSLSYNGNVVFQESSPQGGKSKIIQDIRDSIDEINDGSTLPKVDTTPPVDTSSMPQWMQKIVNGLSAINQNVQGGITSIIDKLDSINIQLPEWLQNILDDIKGALTTYNIWIQNTYNLISGFFTMFNSMMQTTDDDFEDALMDSVFMHGYSDFTNYSNQFDSVMNSNPASGSDLQFEIPLQGTVLYSSALQKITISFAFFDRIRNGYLTFLALVLGVGFYLHIRHTLPSILSGGAGIASDAVKNVKGG